MKYIVYDNKTMQEGALTSCSLYAISRTNMAHV